MKIAEELRLQFPCFVLESAEGNTLGFQHPAPSVWLCSRMSLKPRSTPISIMGRHRGNSPTRMIFWSICD